MPSLAHFDLGNEEFFILGFGSVNKVTVWCDQLTLTGKSQGSPRTNVRTKSVCSNGEKKILCAASDHGLLAVGKNQIGWVAQEVSTLQGKHSCNFWEYPIETDHDANFRATQRNRIKRSATGVEILFFRIKEM